MHSLVSFNHQILPAADVRIQATCSAALYGKGVFTTIAVYRSKPFLMQRHWQRLLEDALKTGIDLSAFTAAKVETTMARLIEVNKIEDARVRLTFFDISPGSIWPGAAGDKTAILFQSADRRPDPGNLSLTVSPFPVNSGSPLAGVKSCNYLENILAVEKAKADGFDEAVRLNERGEVVSASLANVFWIKNGTLFTPELKTGCISGTTRGFVLELAKEVTDLPVLTVRENLSGMLESDEIFLTSAGIGIAVVGSVGKKKFATEISKHLGQIFNARLGLHLFC